VLVEGAGTVVVEVAGEDGVAVDEEEAALAGGERLHGIGIDDEDFDAVERLADGAGTDVAGAVGGDDGGAFGDAVALGEDGVGRELLRAGEEGIGTFFRADDDDAERIEIAGAGGVEDVAEEGGRGEKDGGFVGGDFADEAGGVGGIGVMDDAEAAEQGQDDVARDAEAVERREEAEQDVAAFELERGAAGGDDGGEVAVGERDGLGRFFGAGGEEDDGGIVGTGFGQRGEDVVREEARAEERKEGLDFADVLAEVFEEDKFDAFDFDADAVDEFLRGDDALDAHDFRGVGEVDGAGGPVEEDGKFFGGEERHEGGVGGDGRGEHETDGIAGKRGEAFGHEARAGEEAGVGDDAGEIVRSGGFVRMRDGLADEGFEEVRAVDGVRRVRIGTRGVPDFRDGYRRAGVGGDEALGEAGEFADVGGDEVAAESEALLNGLREVHAVEAVEAEIFEDGGELLFVGGERALEFFLEDVEGH